jgi:N-acetylneuraminate synthase/N,N'-diacetyllegionaminate synthase
MNKIKIGKRWIGEGEPTFISAEIGINHNGDVKLAKKMIDVSLKCGVDAVKFQVFKADEFVSDPDEVYGYRSQGEEITESMLEMFKRYEFTKDEWMEVIDYCKQEKVEFFITPQNPSDLDLILSLSDIPAIKVGADDLTNLELLGYYAKKNKPMIISAGMAYQEEIDDAVKIIKETGNNDLIILHCVSSYPADASEVNLKKVLSIKRIFDVIVGFSDHTIGSTAAIGAVAIGAKVIEKHFTLDNSLPGPDHWFSADPVELKNLVEGVRLIDESIGDHVLQPTDKEMEMRKLCRRSIVAFHDIEKDEIIRRDMIEFKRPGTGLPPKNIKDLIGKRVKNDIKKNEQIKLDNVY